MPFNKKTINKLFLLLAIVGLGGYLYFVPAALTYLYSFDWLYILPIALAYVLFYLFNALMLQVIVSSWNEGVKFKQLFLINQSASLVGYIMPLKAMTIGVRGLLLKKHLHMPLSVSSGGALVSVLVQIQVSLILLLAAIFLRKEVVIFSENEMVLFLVIIMLSLPLGYYIIRSVLLPWLKTKSKIWNNFIDGIIQIGFNRYSKLVVIFTLQCIFSSIIMFFLYLGAGEKIDFFACIFITMLANLSGILSITPGNIGVKEAMLGTAAIVMTVPVDVTVSVILLDRFIQLVMLLLTGGSTYMLAVRNSQMRES